MNKDCAGEKKALRKRILSLRDALPIDARQQKSAVIQSRLLSLPEFTASRTVALFVSCRSEVLTESIIRAALSLGKVTALPITDLARKQLLLSRITDYDADLAPGTWGILEPKPDRISPVTPDELDLVIAPGAVFDRQGRRIGYGGGFYDGLLKSMTVRKLAIALALAFALQIVDEVPFDPSHDEPVDIIITEEEVIYCRDERANRWPWLF
jgi:5-formyltetrahydrofolate cyclo-ligase